MVNFQTYYLCTDKNNKQQIYQPSIHFKRTAKHYVLYLYKKNLLLNYQGIKWCFDDDVDDNTRNGDVGTFLSSNLYIPPYDIMKAITFHWRDNSNKAKRS